jgi:hydroxymethylpyrimidine/phosphomethylpyrimidine kinase
MTTTATQSTGPTFADAVNGCIAARIAAGQTPEQAIEGLKDFLRRETRRHANLNHFAATGQWLPENGVDRCDCGCKFWDGDRCADCGDRR